MSTSRCSECGRTVTARYRRKLSADGSFHTTLEWCEEHPSAAALLWDTEGRPLSVALHYVRRAWHEGGDEAVERLVDNYDATYYPGTSLGQLVYVAQLWRERWHRYEEVLPEPERSLYE